jgi:hypothetical protein
MGSYKVYYEKGRTLISMEPHERVSFYEELFPVTNDDVGRHHDITHQKLQNFEKKKKGGGEKKVVPLTGHGGP